MFTVIEVCTKTERQRLCIFVLVVSILSLFQRFIDNRLDLFWRCGTFLFFIFITSDYQFELQVVYCARWQSWSKSCGSWVYLHLSNQLFSFTIVSMCTRYNVCDQISRLHAAGYYHLIFSLPDDGYTRHVPCTLKYTYLCCYSVMYYGFPKHKGRHVHGIHVALVLFKSV
jgi:hypothetical protein